MPSKTPIFVPAWPAHGPAQAEGTNTQERPVVSQPSSGQHFSTFFGLVLSCSHVYIFQDQFIIRQLSFFLCPLRGTTSQSSCLRVVYVLFSEKWVRYGPSRVLPEEDVALYTFSKASNYSEIFDFAFVFDYAKIIYFAKAFDFALSCKRRAPSDSKN